jgi:hypothetical protein
MPFWIPVSGWSWCRLEMGRCISVTLVRGLLYPGEEGGSRAWVWYFRVGFWRKIQKFNNFCGLQPPFAAFFRSPSAARGEVDVASYIPGPARGACM